MTAKIPAIPSISEQQKPVPSLKNFTDLRPAMEAAKDGAGWEDLVVKFGLPKKMARLLVFGKKS